MNFGTPGSPAPKSSIFGSLAPAPAPAPAAAPRGAVDPEAVNALKLKIDALEKNIISQIEKRLAPPAKAPGAPVPPPPPPPQDYARARESDLLYRKIEELERRLADFGHAASLTASQSASQLKNIEESKISARREIEDLLKAVREQQKYSEMDRQMHEQLQKAWTRAEEMEKKLMDFYSSMLAMETRRREDTSATSDKSAAALDLLSARLAGLEEKISALAAKPADQDQKRAQDEFFARAEAMREQAAAAQQQAAAALASSVKESAASYKEVFDNYVRRELELLRGTISAESDAMRRAADATAEETRKFLHAQTALAGEKTAQFESLVQANRIKAEGVEAALEVSARRQALALEEFSRRLEGDLRGMNTDFASAIKTENDERFRKFGAKYADALLSVTFIENFRASVAESIDKLDGYERQLASFLAEVSPVQLEKALGVSGLIIRKQFEAMAGAVKTLKADNGRLRDIKRGVEEKFKDIFGDR